MGEKMICITRYGSGVNVELNGTAIALLAAFSALAESMMASMCDVVPGNEKTSAELLIHATKQGIESYLRKNAGGGD